MTHYEFNGNKIYLDGYAKEILDKTKEAIRKDWDNVVIIDGVEGGGKSVFAQQLACYVDETLILDRVCFNPKEFRDAISKAGKGQAIIYDEAFGGLSSRAAMSQVNKALVEMLMEIRQKNLHIFIVCPSFFEVDKYAAIHRSRFLFHIYTPTNKPFERGYWKFYNYDIKKTIYLEGKRNYSYCRKCNFFGRFTKGYPLGDEEYRKKKLESLTKNKDDKNLQPQGVRAKRQMQQRDEMIKYIYNTQKGITQKEMAAKFGMTQVQIGTILNSDELNNKAEGWD